MCALSYSTTSGGGLASKGKRDLRPCVEVRDRDSQCFAVSDNWSESAKGRPRTGSSEVLKIVGWVLVQPVAKTTASLGRVTPVERVMVVFEKDVTEAR